MALPASRDQTANPGDEIDPGLLNSVQDAIVELSLEVNRRGWRHGFEGRIRVASGILDHDLNGNIQSTAAPLTFRSSFDLNEHDSLVQIRFRVEDNGVDKWQCDVFAVNEDGNSALLGTKNSTGGGALEYVTIAFAPYMVFGNEERFVMQCSTPNTDGSPMRVLFAEITTG